VFETVKRAEWVKLQALDRDGRLFEIQADGLLAVCFQHEIDHLDGKLFVDYLTQLKQKRIRKKLEKEQMLEKVNRQAGVVAANPLGKRVI